MLQRNSRPVGAYYRLYGYCLSFVSGIFLYPLRLREIRAVCIFVRKNQRRHFGRSQKSTEKSRPLKVTDLGCGSGALLLPLAKEFPEHQFTGYEWDIVPLTMGKIKAAGLKNITFVKGDYMKQSYADMDLILCYVLKVTGEPLGKKLAQEIKQDCIVISEMFPLGHLHEIKQIESSIYGVPEKIYVYQKPHSQKDSVQPRKSAPHNGKTKSQSEKSAPQARKAKSQAGKETPGAGKSKISRFKTKK